VGLKTSVGAVIAVLRGSDPDNKNAIHNDPSNHSVVIKNKQQLTYSLTPAQNSWPFRIDRNSLFKSEVSDIEASGISRIVSLTFLKVGEPMTCTTCNTVPP